MVLCLSVVDNLESSFAGMKKKKKKPVSCHVVPGHSYDCNLVVHIWLFTKDLDHMGRFIVSGRDRFPQ